MSAPRRAPSDFDALAMYAAMDAQRIQRGLSWRQVADQIWAQSAALNRTRNDHPISPSTLTGIAKRRDTTCQHALAVLRWLGRHPESFVPKGATLVESAALPLATDAHRLRWDLSALYEALDAARRERALTWVALAKQLRCSDNQLRGIRTARYAIGMTLAMRITQWLERPASAFVYAAKW